MVLGLIPELLGLIRLGVSRKVLLKQSNANSEELQFFSAIAAVLPDRLFRIPYFDQTESGVINFGQCLKVLGQRSG